MKVTLIQPTWGRRKGKKFSREWSLEPITIAGLKGVTPNDIKVRFFDDRIEEIDYNEPTDLVGITVETFNALRSYEISEEYRKRGIPVVLGGVHPTLIPEEALEYCDCVVIGQAEELWPKMLQDFKNGKLQRIYSQEVDPPIEKRVIDRSIFKGKKYLPINLIELGRGCSCFCEFCSIPPLFKGKYSSRSVDDVIKEIKQEKMKNVFVIDDNIYNYPELLKEFCVKAKDLNIKWVGQIGVNVAEDNEILDIMAQSGCIGLLIGFESLRVGDLDRMRKRINQREKYKEYIKKINKRGIRIYASFVMGYDDETLETIDETYNFCMENKFFLANFYPLTPFPGTSLYKRLEREQRLTNPKWWLDPSFRYGNFSFEPKNISIRAITKKVDDVKSKFYSLKSILIRGFDMDTTGVNFSKPLLYFSFNYRTRKEVIGRSQSYLGLGRKGVKK